MSGPAFRYSRPGSVDDALAQGAQPGAAFLAGGTDLPQLWKLGTAAPAHVIDISRLPLNEIKFVDNSLTLGALARLSDVASHFDVAQHHPLIADAILASASGWQRPGASKSTSTVRRPVNFRRNSNSSTSP
jgi:xanthine dehydrogenase YagS FAD-binding subunit